LALYALKVLGAASREERERGERDSVSLFVKGAMDEERAAID